MSGPRWVDAPAGRRRPRGRLPALASTVLVPVRTGRVQVILWLLVGSLICLNFLVSVTGKLKLLPWGVTRLFDGSDTNSFLTGTGTTVALLAALLMFGSMVAARHRGDLSERGWRWLGWLALVVFADETTSLHQSFAAAVRDRYHVTGVAGYTWALMYLPAAAVLACVLLRDVRHFPVAVRRRLLPGVVLYGIGVVGLEPFVARLAKQRGTDSLSFELLAALADSCAIVGLVLVFSAALVGAGRLADGFTFALLPEDDEAVGHHGTDRAPGGC